MPASPHSRPNKDRIEKYRGNKESNKRVFQTNQGDTDVAVELEETSEETWLRPGAPPAGGAGALGACAVRPRPQPPPPRCLF